MPRSIGGLMVLAIAGTDMSLKAMEWAVGLRASLHAEIEAIVARGIRTSSDFERLISLRTQMKQVDTLIVALNDLPPIDALQAPHSQPS
jgi:hypothetical protein